MPFPRIAAAVLMLAAVVMATIPGTASAAAWSVDHEQSRLGFVGTQGSTQFEGEFEDFEADITFDPDDLAGSKVVVLVDMASATTGSRDRDSQLPADPWFDTDAFPRARFETTAIRRVGDNAYEAAADLTIKGMTREVVLPFTLDIEGDTARMEGEAVLMRLNYDIGTGDWSDTAIVANEVKVVVDLTATRAR